MDFFLSPESRSPVCSFPITFDVPLNRIRADTLNSTTASLNSLLGELAREIISPDAQLRLYVLPPEMGSFRSKFGLVVIAGATFAFLNSNMGSAFVRGLTGKSPTEYAELTGEQLSQLIDKFSSFDEQLDRDLILKNGLACTFLVEAGLSYLEKSSRELAEAGIDTDQLPRSTLAKNEFYRFCELDPTIRTVQFGQSGKPIKRNQFSKRIVQITSKDDQDWQFATKTLRVTSPNWDRLDNRRKWKARDEADREVYFSIVDENFWDFVDAGSLKHGSNDQVVIQVAYQIKDGRARNIFGVNVIDYNEQSISRELSIDDLIGKLEELIDLDFDDDEPNLITYMEEEDPATVSEANKETRAKLRLRRDGA